MPLTNWTSDPRPAPGEGRARGPSVTARLAAGGALLLALVLVALIVLDNGSSYTLRIPFQDASGLVKGNDVLIGPDRAGTVQSIG